MDFDFKNLLDKVNVSHIGIPALIVCLFLIHSGQVRVVISALKNQEKAEFYISRYSMYIIPSGKEKLSPVERIRFYTETAKDRSLYTYVMLYTTRFEHRIYGSKADVFDEKKRQMYNDISFFLSDDSQTEFDSTYTFTEKSAVYGYIFALLSILFTVFGPKKSLTPVFKKIADHVPDKPVGKKSEKTIVSKPSKNGLLRVIIAAFDKNININPELYITPETGSMALACLSDQTADLQSKYGSNFEYIICNNMKGSAEILLKAEDWMKGFNGYLIVHEKNLSGISKGTISDFYKAHRNNDSECTILTTESETKKIPFGKIIRNVANRITKISESEEEADASAVSEVYAGALCFNTKVLYKVLNGLNPAESEKKIEITRMAEAYYKNGSRVNTFTLKNSDHKKISAIPQIQDQILPGRKLAGIMVATGKINAATVKKCLDSLNSAGISLLSIITRSEYISLFDDYAGDNTFIMASDSDMGDADDILRSADKFINFNGDILVIPDSENIISGKDIEKVVTAHNTNSNIVTCIQEGENRNILYCVNSFQFFYAVKKVGRDEDSKKYMLYNIIDILKNDNKRIQIITPEELDR